MYRSFCSVLSKVGQPLSLLGRVVVAAPIEAHLATLVPNKPLQRIQPSISPRASSEIGWRVYGAVVNSIASTSWTDYLHLERPANHGLLQRCASSCKL